jgi:hypothetical protein
MILAIVIEILIYINILIFGIFSGILIIDGISYNDDRRLITGILFGFAAVAVALMM